MFCEKCGNELKDTAKFCDKCGAPTGVGAAQIKPAETRTRKPSAKQALGEGQMISPNIAFCDDGKYRWIYEYSLLKNPGIFSLIWKIFFFIVLGIMAFVMILDTAEGYMDGERLLEDLKILGIILLVMTALIVVSYLIYAAMMGGKYIVIFEMDEQGVNHKQLPKQAKKIKKMAAATFFLGAASGNFSTMAAGLNVRTEMYSDFKSVKKVKAYPRKGLIKVNNLLQHNQVFAHPEDFDFVLNYINERVKESARSAK